jgi:long-chain acyl-CoA synthetase
MSESVLTLFDASVRRFNKRPAIQYFCPKKGAWTIKTWTETSFSVNKLANALKSLQFASGDRIAILSMTRPEWVVADIAIMKACSVVVPIYHSSLTDQIAYILADAEAKAIFVENEDQLKKIRAIEKSTGNLKKVIVFDPVSGPLFDNEIYFDDFVANQDENCMSPDVDPHAVASLVYTSGTTGEPKGAMISHDNLIYEALVIDKLGVLSSEDVQLMFLPLAHIFARVLELAWIRTGHLLAFAQSIEKVVDDMAVIKPTFMAGVPRIFEKIRAKIIETALASGGLKKLLIQFAFNEADRLSQDHSSAGIKTKLAKALVFDAIGKKLNDKFGGRLRFFVSGGAPLAMEVFTFFKLSNIVICEGYGLTETTAATCLNLPWALKIGSVGRAMPGTDLILSEDKEILVRGRGVFLGFWRKDEQSKEVLDQDGWFHTGDIGEIDADGFVRIIDRKRDIIVTSQGKNVAPQRVENLVKSKSPIIGHVVVVGDKKPYLTALVALDRLNAQVLASQEGDNMTMSELASSKIIYQEVKNAITTANLSLASFEQIKRFLIVDREFEIGKELTPTLKVKRKAAVEMFKKEVKTLYS